MADPYASRSSLAAALEPPAGEPAWLGQLADRCAILGAPDQAVAAAGRAAAIVHPDTGPLAPIARLGPELATLLLALQVEGEVAGLDAALAALRRRRAEPTYMLKHGFVAGPEGAPGCFAVTGALLLRVLEADARGEVGWERDPDWGYEVAAELPGLGPRDAEALLPRLLYAAHDRVYEHAELVAETKRRWHERLSGVEGVPAEALAAIGWPPEPTGSGWKGRAAG